MKISKKEFIDLYTGIAKWEDIEKDLDIIRIEDNNGAIFEVYFLLGELYIKNIGKELSHGRTKIEIIDKTLIAVK